MLRSWQAVPSLPRLEIDSLIPDSSQAGNCWHSNWSEKGNRKQHPRRIPRKQQRPLDRFGATCPVPVSALFGPSSPPRLTVRRASTVRFGARSIIRFSSYLPTPNISLGGGRSLIGVSLGLGLIYCHLEVHKLLLPVPYSPTASTVLRAVRCGAVNANGFECSPLEATSRKTSNTGNLAGRTKNRGSRPQPGTGKKEGTTGPGREGTPPGKDQTRRGDRGRTEHNTKSRRRHEK